MILLLVAALALFSPPTFQAPAAESKARALDGGATRWQTLDHDLAPFTQRFNDYSDRYRLVMLVSPT